MTAIGNASEADVSDLNRLLNYLHEESELEGEPYHPNDFGSTTHFPSSYFVDDDATSFDFRIDFNVDSNNPGSVYEDLNSFPSVEEAIEQMLFHPYQFESREADFVDAPIWDFGHEDSLGVLAVDFELHLGFPDRYDEYRANNNGNVHISEIEGDEIENLNSIIDRIDDISISSDILSQRENGYVGEEEREGQETERNIDWGVLLDVNDFDRAMAYNSNSGGGAVVMDNRFGSLPAAISVVENLDVMVLTEKELREKSVELVCAVCKDEFAVGEKVTRIPCCHLYHGDCILPWLKIRNTCPVCRYQLPIQDYDWTDDTAGFQII